MGLIQVTPPSVEPLTIAEVAAHLRLDATNQEPSPDAMTAALATPAVPGNVTAGAHRYACTFVTADGETVPGPLTSAVVIANGAVNGQVALTGIPLGGAAVTARALYRTQANGTALLKLATLNDNSTTTYTDTLADGSLGAGAPASNTTGDPFLASLIQTARDYAETFTRKRFLAQTWTLTLDTFPLAACDPFRVPLLELQGGLVPMVGAPLRMDWIRLNGIELPNPPLQSIVSIHYLDPAGALQTLSPNAYRVDVSGERGLVTPTFGTNWPATLPVPGAVAITFVCGYSTPAAVPATIRHALKMLTAHYYGHRELFVTKRFALEIPLAVDALLWANRSVEAA